ncbi:TraR/DksA family transcriptional regulator [Stieleria varia]|uniref:RNA polymerase-binding transcription factor DksA n=1 Tax=Stieleria varia TaxID=2528005 RepID=A0A5C5ZQS5_9BACT|nr:TraR/DksA family transcriptional regulator [Stieleria varia]TWT89425.1 RNA polymerase-binding transcription factor DksA [Stieleria varia]
MKTQADAASLDRTRQQLESKLQELVARTERIDSDLSRKTNDDWEERAVELEDDEVLSSIGNANLAEIQQIHRALRQIELGTYGICTHCNAEIDPGRLELLPYATSCMRCSQA